MDVFTCGTSLTFTIFPSFLFSVMPCGCLDATVVLCVVAELAISFRDSRTGLLELISFSILRFPGDDLKTAGGSKGKLLPGPPSLLGLHHGGVSLRSDAGVARASPTVVNVAERTRGKAPRSETPSMLDSACLLFFINSVSASSSHRRFIALRLSLLTGEMLSWLNVRFAISGEELASLQIGKSVLREVMCSGVRLAVVSEAGLLPGEVVVVVVLWDLSSMFLLLGSARSSFAIHSRSSCDVASSGAV